MGYKPGDRPRHQVPEESSWPIALKLSDHSEAKDGHPLTFVIGGLLYTTHGFEECRVDEPVAAQIEHVEIQTADEGTGAQLKAFGL